MNYLDGTFKLETKVAPGVKYAAVSYRWGSPSAPNCYMLTRDTANSMQKGVSVKALPKTILEACEIAHRLGLEYAWIDRLCIFQDSDDDWSQEASRMAFIYKHAFITIAASCASDESQGCFRKRNAPGIQPLWLFSNPLISAEPEAGYSQTIYISSQNNQEKLGYLAHRGWVLQERILSQRIVHFAEEEVHWECRKQDASEAWPGCGKQSGAVQPLRSSILYGRCLDTGTQCLSWHTIVRHYSFCQLTYDSDKLPAMSGLAREMANLRKDANDAEDEYLGGLWRSTLLLDLCWIVDNDTAKIPKEYLAPSWSWASLHAKVKFTVVAENCAMAKLKGVQVKNATADTCGAVHDGWIHFFGYLKPVMVIQGGTPVDTLGDWLQYGSWPAAVRGANSEILPFVAFAIGSVDVEAFLFDEKASASAFCVPIVKIRDMDPDLDIQPEVYCLLLVPCGPITRFGGVLPSPRTTNVDEFQRVGLARLRIQNWLQFQAWLDESPGKDIIIR